MCLCALPASPACALEVSARCAVLICADTGLTLYEKNADMPRPMASTTKIMTALLALEAAEKTGDPVVPITEEMVEVEGSSMGLQAGDEITLSNLAAGMLLASGNDAANAAALYLSGSQEAFAEQMNSRGKELGLKNTGFVTPSGLDSEGHYSTARDLAILTKAALQNERFGELCGAKTYTVSFKAPEKTVQFTNHNKLLWQYEGAIGVKTGFTKKSGRCLVSAAKRDGITLIAVTLDAADDWNDHISLFEEGFSSLKKVSFDESDRVLSLPVVGGEQEQVTVRGLSGGELAVPATDAEKIKRQVLLPRFVYAPAEQGEVLGKVVYSLEGAEIFSVPITAQESVGQKEKEEKGFFSWIAAFFSRD